MGQSTRQSNGSVNKQINNNIPTYEEFKNHALSKKPNINQELLKLKFESWVENDWKDGNDKKIKNWKSKLTNTVGFIADYDKSHSTVNQNELPSHLKGMVF